VCYFSHFLIFDVDTFLLPEHAWSSDRNLKHGVNMQAVSSSGGLLTKLHNPVSIIDWMRQTSA
jgi:hypothetical protein